MFAPISGLSLLDLIRFERSMACIHGLGSRTTAEYAAAVARRTNPVVALALAEEFVRLSRAQIVAAGADRPLPRQLVEVPILPRRDGEDGDHSHVLMFAEAPPRDGGGR